MNLFDSFTSQYVIAGIDVKKIIKLRLSLLKDINGKKSMKELK